MKAVQIYVSGKVQGVFFRASTKEQADLLHITGFVRNESDGSVYIEAEGDDGALKLFIDWCKKGPSRAVVSKCEVHGSIVKDYKSFEIERG